jgi:hypothetical protein
MRNPLRSEEQAFRFLIVVIVGALVIAGCAALNTWVGVAAAVIVVGGIVYWLRVPPTAGEKPELVVPPQAQGLCRVLLLAGPDTDAAALGERMRARLDGRDAEVLIVVPALATAVEAATGAVDDKRAEAQNEAEAIARQLAGAGIAARGVIGADDPLLAVEDALREFGADEVVLVAAADLLAEAHERIGVPVSLLG